MFKPLVIAAALGILLSTTTASADKGINFIVNKANPVNELSARDIVDLYQKKKRLWPDGSTVRFIDRNHGSAERKDFIGNYLKQSDSDVDLFWINQKVNTGDGEPIQVSSDTLMVQMVKAFNGAIGYVSAASAAKMEGVKVIRVTAASGE